MWKRWFDSSRLRVKFERLLSGRGDIVSSRPSEWHDTFALRGVFNDIADPREVARLIRDLAPEPT